MRYYMRGKISGDGGWCGIKPGYGKPKKEEEDEFIKRKEFSMENDKGV